MNTETHVGLTAEAQTLISQAEEAVAQERGLTLVQSALEWLAQEVNENSIHACMSKPVLNAALASCDEVAVIVATTLKRVESLARARKSLSDAEAWYAKLHGKIHSDRQATVVVLCLLGVLFFACLLIGTLSFR